MYYPEVYNVLFSQYSPLSILSYSFVPLIELYVLKIHMRRDDT